MDRRESDKTGDSMEAAGWTESERQSSVMQEDDVVANGDEHQCSGLRSSDSSSHLTTLRQHQGAHSSGCFPDRARNVPDVSQRMRAAFMQVKSGLLGPTIVDVHSVDQTSVATLLNRNFTNEFNEMGNSTLNPPTQSTTLADKPDWVSRNGY